jgi:hypothetical protein
MTERPQKWEGRLPASRLDGSRQSENACKYTYKAFKIIISLKIKLLHFSLNITRIISKMCFKRYNMFAEAFHSMIKCIHLALEVKASFGNSTPVTSSSTKSSSQKPRVSTNTCHRHCRKEEKKSYKIKLEWLRSVRLIRRDQAIRLLDMQKLWIYYKALMLKTTSTSLNTFKHVISQV